MTEYKTIYLAGKMRDPDWRYPLFTEHDKSVEYSFHDGTDPLTISDVEDYPLLGDETVFGMGYVGPFFVDTTGGHGYYEYDEGNSHGGNVTATHEVLQESQKALVHKHCMSAIKRADLVFAWIDSTDCYGTIAELGYARALGKQIWIAGPKQFDDLWFVYQMADGTCFHLPEPYIALIEFQLAHYIRTISIDSPIEQKFWDEWYQQGTAILLISQYQIGRYYVDFAHPRTKTVIELDGFASHSSTSDIANDRRRQREIEAKGWHVIRFGGKEIHNDVSKCVREAQQIINNRQASIVV